MRRVVVTGMGAVAPLGHDAGSFFEALIEGRSGVRRFQPAWAPAQYNQVTAPVLQELTHHFTKLRLISLDRVAQLSLLATREAASQSGTDFSVDSGESAGIYWGTGMGGANTIESTMHDLLVNKAVRLKPSSIVLAMNNAATGQIGIEFGIRGPSYTFSSACSSSNVAIGEAYRAIRFGLVKTAVAGGGEALLTQGVIKAWESLQTLAKVDPDRPETSCRPFAADRSGFVLGEGAAALILEEEEAARLRGANILAEIVGYGNTTDAGHIAQPDKGGQARAMKAALADAGMAPQQVTHINAHGTGTKVGDLTETNAIKEVFGAHAGMIPISATKALHGHLMGATGALEMIAAIEAIRRRTVPPTAHLGRADPECDLDYVSEGARILSKLDVVMSNSFGFGGNNAVVIAKRYTP
ncbi:MAG: beta-ketoacyl-[acyl-carrier-protein] synthase family protein [Sterolibacterium sp.]